MKKFIYLITLIFAISLFTLYYACKKDSNESKIKDLSKLSAICDAKPQVNVTATINSSGVSDAQVVPYTVSLLLKESNGNGTYTWIWKVVNPKPGNGKDDGTVQDLSHWGISLGLCAKKENIVNAATSTDGNSWKTFSPEYKEDKSQDCYKSPILKFDVGTSGGNATYYRIIVNKNFTVEKTDAVFKSGKNTGCGVFRICALGCPVN